jgi:1-aminocyclopropane-1-carboxylate deaminase
MTLTYVDRAQYRAKIDPAFIDHLHDEFGDFYLIPEEVVTRTAYGAAPSSQLRLMLRSMCCAARVGLGRHSLVLLAPLTQCHLA